MLKKLLLLVFLLLSISSKVSAYDCVSRQFEFNQPTASDYMKLKFLSNCSWIKDAQRVYINIFTNYDGQYYNNEYEDTTNKHFKFINTLNKQIEKTIMNELYFTNWKYTSFEELRNFDEISSYYSERNKLKELSAERIVMINVDVELYKYNSSTDLHYGKITLKIEPSFPTSNHWYYNGKDTYSKLYDKEFVYDIPIAGYDNKEKILNTNITNQISYWISDSFSKLYKKIASNSNYNKSYNIEYFNYKHNDDDELLGLKYLMEVNNVGINLKIRKESAYLVDWYKLTESSTDEEVKKVINDAYIEKYGNLKVLSVDIFNKYQKEFEDYYIPIVKKEIETR
jgi:hypothetical protein